MNQFLFLALTFCFYISPVAYGSDSKVILTEEQKEQIGRKDHWLPLGEGKSMSASKVIRSFEFKSPEYDDPKFQQPFLDHIEDKQVQSIFLSRIAKQLMRSLVVHNPENLTDIIDIDRAKLFFKQYGTSLNEIKLLYLSEDEDVYKNSKNFECGLVLNLIRTQLHKEDWNSQSKAHFMKNFEELGLSKTVTCELTDGKNAVPVEHFLKQIAAEAPAPQFITEIKSLNFTDPNLKKIPGSRLSLNLSRTSACSDEVVLTNVTKSLLDLVGRDKYRNKTSKTIVPVNYDIYQGSCATNAAFSGQLGDITKTTIDSGSFKKQLEQAVLGVR